MFLNMLGRKGLPAAPMMAVESPVSIKEALKIAQRVLHLLEEGSQSFDILLRPKSDCVLGGVDLDHLSHIYDVIDESTPPEEGRNFATKVPLPWIV